MTLTGLKRNFKNLIPSKGILLPEMLKISTHSVTTSNWYKIKLEDRERESKWEEKTLKKWAYNEWWMRLSPSTVTFTHICFNPTTF